MTLSVGRSQLTIRAWTAFAILAMFYNDIDNWNTFWKHAIFLDETYYNNNLFHNQVTQSLPKWNLQFLINNLIHRIYRFVLTHLRYPVGLDVLIAIWIVDREAHQDDVLTDWKHFLTKTTEMKQEHIVLGRSAKVNLDLWPPHPREGEGGEGGRSI